MSFNSSRFCFFLFLWILFVLWFLIGLEQPIGYHCHNATPNELTEKRISLSNRMLTHMKRILRELGPMNNVLHRQPVSTTKSYQSAGRRNELVIKGPVIDPLDGNEYYDVTFPDYWFDFTTNIVQHWQSTLPNGIEPVYNYLHPQIFFHGRSSNPYLQLREKGLWMDDGYQSLWTVALTNKMYALKWVYDVSIQSIADGIGYVVVYRFKNRDHQRCKIKQMRMDNSKWWSENANYIKARYDFYFFDICETFKYPDAYVFTQTAQQTNCPLEIARVYRIHFENYACHYEYESGAMCGMFRFKGCVSVCCQNQGQKICVPHFHR